MPPKERGIDSPSGGGWRSMAAHPPLISLLLAAAAVVAFYPGVHCQFVSYDDPDYVTANPHVKGGLTGNDIAWAFRASYAGNWHPLTWLSHMFDVQVFALNPAGHHLTNLAFHAANSVLLFILLRQLTGTLRRSAVVASLFALHPLHVESVAWVSERKDVLSAFFFLLTLMAYGRYAAGNDEGRMTKAERSPKTEGRRHPSGWFVLSLFFFGLGLMSKPMLVTVPFVLLLLDYWPLERFQVSGFRFQVPTLSRLIWEKVSFFGLSAVSCLVTIIVQHQAVQPLANLSMGARLGNTLVSYVRYLGKTFWPLGLATPYPHPGHWPIGTVTLAALLLCALTLVATGSFRRFPFAITGWFWFLGMLVPVIGLVQVGEQSMADRYTYLPLIGIFIILVWAGAEAALRLRVPAVGWGVVAGLVLLLCAFRTRDQLRYWRNSESLYSHAVAVTKKNFIAYYNLGSYLDNEGRVDDAMTNYFRAVAIQPNYPDPLNNIGCVLATRKQFAEAIPYFEAALRSNPNFTRAHENLANSLRELGRYQEAIPHFQAVAKENPDDPDVLNKLGNALSSQGRFAEAIPYYEASLRAKADQSAAHYDLANALAKVGRMEDAISHYRLAVQMNPNNAEAQSDLGLALANHGQLAEAILQFREAVRIRPKEPRMLSNLARALASENKFDEALPLFEEALRIAPTNAAVHANLAITLANQGKLDQAIIHLREALRYRPNDVSAHFNLGKALAAQHKTDEARQEYNEVLRLKPDSTPARQALQQLPQGD